MLAKEFYIFDDDLWCLYDDGRNEKITESDVELVNELIAIIMEQYPEAYKALSACYQKSARNIPYYQYLIVRRFCKCNFGVLDDSAKDVDSSGVFHFERVSCPLRGECKYEGIICGASFCSKLTPAEERVAVLYHQGSRIEEISDKLYLSPNTIRNHIKSIYRKLGVHDIGEFVRYADEHRMFENKQD